MTTRTRANWSRRGNPAANPTPDMIRAARQDAGLTQREAAQLVYATERGWRDWEAGRRRMPASVWELFLVKISEDKMDKKTMLARAQTMRRLASGIEAEWWAGYVRGLRRHIHGANFGTDEEHQAWLAAGGDPVRDARGAGYRAGLTGEWHEPLLNQPMAARTEYP